jgi:hypothetical protein
MVVDESIQLQTSPTLILVANSSLHELINAMDEAIATILHLAEHGPALDDGGPVYFPNCIEILQPHHQHAGPLEKLSRQLSTSVLPRPPVVENQR